MISSPGIGWQQCAKLSTPRSLPLIMIRSEPLPHVGDGEVLIATEFSGVSDGTELLA